MENRGSPVAVSNAETIGGDACQRGLPDLEQKGASAFDVGSGQAEATRLNELFEGKPPECRRWRTKRIRISRREL